VCTVCVLLHVCRYQLPAESRGHLLKLFDHAFDVCSDALVEAHKALIALDKDNARAYATKYVFHPQPRPLPRATFSAAACALAACASHVRLALSSMLACHALVS
jgi:hypothetical protein